LHHRTMRRFDARNLLGRQLVVPAADDPAPEEFLARRPRGLAKSVFAFLLLQLGKAREGNRPLDLVLARGAPSEFERPAERPDRIGVQVLVTDEVHGNIALIEPAYHVAAPAWKPLAELAGLTVGAAGECGFRIVEKGDRFVD